MLRPTEELEPLIALGDVFFKLADLEIQARAKPLVELMVRFVPPLMLVMVLMILRRANITEAKVDISGLGISPCMI